MIKKIFMLIFVSISIILGYNITNAATVGGNFSSIPVNYNGNDISSKLNLKLAGKIANGTFLLVGTIPSDLSGDTINGKTIGNCDIADINNTCLETGKTAIFYTEGDTNGVDIKDIVEFYKDGTRPSNGINNFKGMHINKNGIVFFIEHWVSGDGTDMKIWATIPDTTNKTVKFVSGTPVVIDGDNGDNPPIYIDSFVGMSTVDDYLFVHGGQRRRYRWYFNRDDRSTYTMYPMFSVIDLSGLTPTVVYSSPKYFDGTEVYSNFSMGVCFNLITKPNSLTGISSNAITNFNFTNVRANVSNPLSLENACINAGKPYLITNPGWQIYVKGVFVQNNKLYVITELYNVDSRRRDVLLKVSQNPNGKPVITQIDTQQLGNSNEEKTFFEGLFGKNQVMVYDWESITP